METTVHRRNFLGRSFAVLGAATSASFPLGAFGQTATSSLRRADRYQDTYIFDRKPFRWPGGKRLAIWVAPAVEVWSVDKAGSGPNVRPNPNNYSPDVMNYSWREYGIRIGLWRVGEHHDTTTSDLRKRLRGPSRARVPSGVRVPSALSHLQGS